MDVYAIRDAINFEEVQLRSQFMVFMYEIKWNRLFHV